MKPGTILYSVNVDEHGKVEWDFYIIRSIRKGKAFATMKCFSTWGKRSTRIGDFGWLDPVDPIFRRAWRIAEPIPSWYFMATTRAGALRLIIKYHNDPATADDFEKPDTLDKVRRTLKSMLARERNK